MSRNEKFWVDQVTVPHPPPGERQGVGNDKGGGGGTHEIITVPTPTVAWTKA